jgi:arylsulfatase A-like enzyme
MTEYVDIYPTVVELAGLPPAPGLDGKSLVPILNDPGHHGRPFVLSQFARPFKPTMPEVMGYSVRTRNHRYTRWVRWPSREVFEEELYDYRSDRSAVQQGAFLVERRNVSHDPAYGQLRKQLSLMLEQTLQTRTNCDLD